MLSSSFILVFPPVLNSCLWLNYVQTKTLVLWETSLNKTKNLLLFAKFLTLDFLNLSLLLSAIFTIFTFRSRSQNQMSLAFVPYKFLQQKCFVLIPQNKKN